MQISRNLAVWLGVCAALLAAAGPGQAQFIPGNLAVLQIGDGSYAVFLQEAALPGRRGTDVGIVGVRVVTADRQILVGLARAPTATPAQRGSPWLLFGLSQLQKRIEPMHFAFRRRLAILRQRL